MKNNARKATLQHKFAVAKDAPERCVMCKVARKLVPESYDLDYLYRSDGKEEWTTENPPCLEASGEERKLVRSNFNRWVKTKKGWAA